MAELTILELGEVDEIVPLGGVCVGEDACVDQSPTEDVGEDHDDALRRCARRWGRDVAVQTVDFVDPTGRSAGVDLACAAALLDHCERLLLLSILLVFIPRTRDPEVWFDKLGKITTKLELEQF